VFHLPLKPLLYVFISKRIPVSGIFLHPYIPFSLSFSIHSLFLCMFLAMKINCLVLFLRVDTV